MTVTIQGIAESYGADVISGRDVMDWTEYMNRIEWTCSYLDTALSEHRYFPDAIVGITNGGLISADLIGKRVYAGRNTPVLSLWAKRHEAKGQSHFWYFDNEYNDCTFNGIKGVCEKEKPDGIIKILLIDDHMGTGSTAVQAVAYIKNRLGENVRITYIPIVSRRLDTIGVVEEYLPYNYLDSDNKPIFDISEKDFKAQLSTAALYFPYFKKQVNVSTSGG
jgi:hypoxanthine phosphoribosyltransferase